MAYASVQPRGTLSVIVLSLAIDLVNSRNLRRVSTAYWSHSWPERVEKVKQLYPALDSVRKRVSTIESYDLCKTIKIYLDKHGLSKVASE